MTDAEWVRIAIIGLEVITVSSVFFLIYKLGKTRLQLVKNSKQAAILLARIENNTSPRFSESVKVMGWDVKEQERDIA